jgi:predicted GIY-YIG superfamily endonuclease
MPWLVYIIYSQTHCYYYKVTTQVVIRRMQDHNNARNASTANKSPWVIAFVRSFSTQSEVPGSRFKEAFGTK